MRPTPILRLVSAIGLAVVLVGCGSSTETPDPAAPSTPVTSESTDTPEPTLTSPEDGKTRTVTMTGTIEDGVENGCLVFTDEATGETYSITTDRLPGSPAGPRVTVTGTVDPEMMSFCQQGPVLLVEEVTEPTD